MEATDDAFWDQFWADTTTTVQDVFALVPAAEIRAVREESPSNLATLCYKVGTDNSAVQTLCKRKGLSPPLLLLVLLKKKKKKTGELDSLPNSFPPLALSVVGTSESAVLPIPPLPVSGSRLPFEAAYQKQNRCTCSVIK